MPNSDDELRHETLSTWTSEIIARGQTIWSVRTILARRVMRDELCGHADNSAGAGYVQEGSIEAMKAAI
jgi:hypothetical protein